MEEQTGNLEALLYSCPGMHVPSLVRLDARQLMM